MLRSPVVVEASVRPMLIRLLVERVLDLKDLAGDVHLAHVNCEGEHFFVLHKHFERMYAALVEHADLLGERVRQLEIRALRKLRRRSGRLRDDDDED